MHTRIAILLSLVFVAGLLACDDKPEPTTSSPESTPAAARAQAPDKKPMTQTEWYKKACPMVSQILENAKKQKRPIEQAKLDEICASQILGNAELIVNMMAVSCGRSMSAKGGDGYPPGGPNYTLKNAEKIPAPLEEIQPPKLTGVDKKVAEQLGATLSSITRGSNKQGGANDGLNTPFDRPSRLRLTYTTGQGVKTKATCTVRGEAYVDREGKKLRVIEKVMTYDEETGGAKGQLMADGKPVTVLGGPDDPEPESTAFRKLDADERKAIERESLETQELRRQVMAELYERKEDAPEEEELPVSENPRQLVTALGRMCIKYFEGRQEYTMGEEPEPWHGDGGIYGARVPVNEKTFPGGVGQRYVSVAEVPKGDELKPTKPEAKQFEASTAKLLGNPFEKPRLYQYIYETGDKKGGGATCRITAIADVDPSNPEQHKVSQVIRISPETGKPEAEPMQEFHAFK